MAVVVFIVPLVGVHRLLEDQKNVLLKESTRNKETLISELFTRLKQGKQAEAGEIKDSLSSVSLAHTEIDRVSTWPWQTHTIRQIAGAITLPIVIWFIQFYLSNILGD